MALDIERMAAQAMYVYIYVVVDGLARRQQRFHEPERSKEARQRTTLPRSWLRPLISQRHAAPRTWLLVVDPGLFLLLQEKKWILIFARTNRRRRMNAPARLKHGRCLMCDEEMLTLFD